MPSYALLLRASTNRVYGEAAFALAQAELAVIGRSALEVEITSTRRSEIGGVGYVVLDTEGPLSQSDLAVLSNLSSLHALYAMQGDLLQPLEVRPVALLDDDIITIQRYSGKTNEAFTHLLVNLALAASNDAFERMLNGGVVRLLDPACGRGTTLNRAAMYGMDVVGIELDQRDVEAYTQFLLTWMKDKRFKHQLAQAKLRKGRDTPAHRITVTYGRSKDRAQHRVVDIIHDDTLAARSHLKASSIDVVVCDLPYGVQHGSTTGQGDLTRGPEALLQEALPVWRELLVPGGAMAVAWNRHTMGRPAVADAVVDSGLELRAAPEDDSFLHRVDRSILRDVLVASRPI